MSRRRGRPRRQYNLKVRTVRRDPIDFEALARAALEQAAMDERHGTSAIQSHRHRKRPQRNNRRKEHSHDYLE